MYIAHEDEKKREYLPRARDVDMSAMIPAVLSTSGGMGRECDKLVKRIAEKLSMKRGERYSDTVSFIRRRIRFDLLRTCVISLRGYKKCTQPEKIAALEFNLRPTAY